MRPIFSPAFSNTHYPQTLEKGSSMIDQNGRECFVRVIAEYTNPSGKRIKVTLGDFWDYVRANRALDDVLEWYTTYGKLYEDAYVQKIYGPLENQRPLQPFAAGGFCPYWD